MKKGLRECADACVSPRTARHLRLRTEIEEELSQVYAKHNRVQQHNALDILRCMLDQPRRDRTPERMGNEYCARKFVLFHDLDERLHSLCPSQLLVCAHVYARVGACAHPRALSRPGAFAHVQHTKRAVVLLQQGKERANGRFTWCTLGQTEAHRTET